MSAEQPGHRWRLLVPVRSQVRDPRLLRAVGAGLHVLCGAHREPAAQAKDGAAGTLDRRTGSVLRNEQNRIVWNEMEQRITELNRPFDRMYSASE